MFRYEFAIPDIHGEYDKLIALLETLENNGLDYTLDSLVFMGDMIDRGSKSREVLEKIKDLTERFPNNVRALLGNHDRFMIDLFYGGDMRRDVAQNRWLWTQYNGGDDTLRSYLGHSADEHIAWLKTLPLYFETEKFFYSHAPIPSSFTDYTTTLTDEHTLTWSYHGSMSEKDFAYNFLKHGKRGVCGHIHQLRHNIWEPRLYDHYLYMDAGCGCHPYAKLFSINLTTGTLYNSGSPEPNVVEGFLV